MYSVGTKLHSEKSIDKYFSRGILFFLNHGYTEILCRMPFNVQWELRKQRVFKVQQL